MKSERPRYGIDEVAQWYFEVWNEPNIDFWGGVPAQGSYFDLYDHTARDLKAVSPRLRVGGPATSAAHWVPEFLAHTAKTHVPVDFVSTHGYADDSPEDMLDTTEDIPMDDRVCRAVAKVRAQIDNQIKASATPNLPLFWTEWNVQGNHESRDTTFTGPALANTIRQCDGLIDQMSWWTFSDVFEEGGPFPKPFLGAFGLRAKGGINKPSFYAFALLHKLGTARLANPAPNVLVTRRPDGTLAIAAWNIADPGTTGHPLPLTLTFRNLSPSAALTLERVDDEHGNVLPRYAAMGSPLDPTESQVDTLNRQTALGPPETLHVTRGTVSLTLEPNALVLIQVDRP